MKKTKLYLGSLLILLSAFLAAPKAIAQEVEQGDNDTRIEKYQDLTETESSSASDSDSISESDLDMKEKKDTMQEEEMDSSIEEPSTRTEEKLEEVQ